MAQAGYSGTPLVKKLGIRPGMRVALLAAPERYVEDVLAPLPEDVAVRTSLRGTFDVVHLFVERRAELERRFAACKAAMEPASAFWVSWPKQASKRPTDLNENVVREIALAGGLVDVKVAAVDATWSALKLVYRLADRP